jgi:hypothetical protein
MFIGHLGAGFAAYANLFSLLLPLWAWWVDRRRALRT